MSVFVTTYFKDGQVFEIEFEKRTEALEWARTSLQSGYLVDIAVDGSRMYPADRIDHIRIGLTSMNFTYEHDSDTCNDALCAFLKENHVTTD